MKKALSFIKNKMVLLGAVMVATIVGGVTTAVVLAAIPDGDGVIHACRTTLTGGVRIIDSASQNCNGLLETGVNWSQGGGGAALHDANGQLIGNALDAPDGSDAPFLVYNSTLNRFITIAYSGTGNYAVINPGNTVYFQSGNCSGQAYTNDNPHSGTKLNLIRTGSSSYGIVQNNASTQTITIGSLNEYDISTDSFTCNSTADTGSLYQISSASLPFTVPLTGPFKF